MMSNFYHHRDEVTPANWQRSQSMMITYVDAVSLYPSAMRLFRYPTEFVRAGRDISDTLIPEILENYASLNGIDEFLKDSPYTYICKATVRNPTGIITVTSERVDGKLKHGHKKSHTGIFDISTLLQSKYLNGSDIEIHEYYEFKADYCFNFVEDLFELRLKYKAAGDAIGSDMIKLILNSLYGKACERMFEESVSSVVKNNGELLDIIKYNEQELYVHKSQDKSGKLFHIAAFILANSKWLMNRVIDTLGGQPGNFYGHKTQLPGTQECLGRYHYPFFSTDTDSMAVYESHFIQSKEYLKDSRVNPNTHALGGFHIDVEVPRGKSVDTSYQPLIVKAAWICAKVYILECIYVDKEGKVQTFFHRRVSGVPGKWVQHFTCEDYLELSHRPEKVDRKTRVFAEEKGYDNGSIWRFDLNKVDGIITKDSKFDSSFRSAMKIGNHRVFSQGSYEKMRETGVPIMLPPVNY